MKGFSDESVFVNHESKKNLRDLIVNLESEIDENGAFEVNRTQNLSNESLEVVEDRDVVMQMVEDFRLMSESDSEDESDYQLKNVILCVVTCTFLSVCSVLDY